MPVRAFRGRRMQNSRLECIRVKTISESERVFVRGTLLDAIEKRILLTSVEIGRNGEISCHTEEWPTYWRAVTKLKSRPISNALAGLRSTWGSYIESGFQHELQREYCFRYHFLLDKITAFRRKTSQASPREAIQRCLAFECFGVRMGKNSNESLVAGTSSVRNPNYLLAKVRYPNALDDVRYLPLVTAGTGGAFPLFYHYRQHRLSPDSEASVLLYLPSDLDARAEGFRCVSQFESLLAEGKDARVDERAARLADKIIVPFLDARNDHDNCTAPTLELLDMGAGSGALAAAICKRTHLHFHRAGANLGLKARLVDLVLPQSRCFWSNKALSNSTGFVYAASADTQGWISEHVRLLREGDVRIGLASQLFNNQSEFQIRPFRDASILPGGAGLKPSTRWRDCLPVRCLGAGQTGPRDLTISTAPLRLAEGRTFRQTSLSRYFQGLQLATETQGALVRGTASQEPVFGYFRRFRPECLAAPDGTSILRRLLAVCSLVLVFDADLRPDDLRAHLESTGLETIEAVDMTRMLRLKGNYCYALVKAKEPGAASLTGERLW